MTTRSLIALGCFVLAAVLSACGSPGSDSDPVMKVRSVGGTYDLVGTSWVRCHANEPEAGKSRRTLDTYAADRITHVEDVFNESTTCAGTPDDSAHTSVTATLDVGPDLAVTWNGAAPAGLADTVTASGLTISAGALSFKTLAFVDETAEPDRLYGGNEDGPLDGAGFPTQLEGLAAIRQ